MHQTLCTALTCTCADCCQKVLRDLERQSMQSTDATKAETEATKAQLETTKAQLSQLERQSSQVLLATEATKTQLLERIEQTEVSLRSGLFFAAIVGEYHVRRRSR